MIIIILILETNVMAKRSKVSCGVCQTPVIDGKDEALLCEGECGLWLHRGCASIPPSRYESLSASEEPFVCLCCSNYQIKEELAQLRTELRDALELHTLNGVHRQQISELPDTVEALKKEVTQLKETLSTVSSELTSTRSSRNAAMVPTVLSDPSPSYAAATATATNPQQRRRPPRTQAQQRKTVQTPTGTRARAARPAKSEKAATETRVQGSRSSRKVAVD